jgi:hypothetical protein
VNLPYSELRERQNMKKKALEIIGNQNKPTNEMSKEILETILNKLIILQISSPI